MRTAVLIPWAIPTIVSAQMWAWMFNDVFGDLNAMLHGRSGIIDAADRLDRQPRHGAWPP